MQAKYRPLASMNAGHFGQSILQPVKGRKQPGRVLVAMTN